MTLTIKDYAKYANVPKGTVYTRLYAGTLQRGVVIDEHGRELEGVVVEDKE